MLTLPWTGASVSEADWHWAVGIWEGEGGVSVFSGGCGTGCPRFHITSTDKDMIIECIRCFDLGYLVCHRVRDGTRKTCWRLVESRRNVIGDWCRVAIPYIRTERKRQQARDTLKTIEYLGPAGASSVRRSKTYGRDHLAQEFDILGLTKGESSAIGGG